MTDPQTQADAAAALRRTLSALVKYYGDEPQGPRLAYYTTADTAARVINSRAIWMRNVTMMNDYSEVSHGIECIDRALDSVSGRDLKAALDSCYPGASERVVGALKRAQDEKGGVCIACFSEHSEHSDPESHLGRLSMWRAYGGSAGVALVFKASPAFAKHGEYLGGSWLKVQYESDLEEVFGRIASDIRSQSSFFKTIGPDGFYWNLEQTFRLAPLALKHPGFKEEKEWRFVGHRFRSRQHHLSSTVETIRGIPQTIKMLKLEDLPGVVGLNLVDCLDEVIIGPCASPEVIRLSFVELLKAVGITESDQLVKVSGIPLRPAY